jgi:hypothetical protein
MNDLATTEPQEDAFSDMRAAKPWLEMVKDAERYFSEWQDKCDKIDKLYADLKKLSAGGAQREMQIFWANLEVLKPSIYSRPPVPVVSSRFKDRKPMLRHSAEILERSLASSFDLEDIDQSMIAIRDDLAICGRGVSWLRLEDEEMDGEVQEQRVCYDHLDRKDFLHEPARKWREVGWVGRKSHLTYEKMRERFEDISGDEYTKAVYQDRKKDGDDYTGEKKACVWEVWHKDKRVVVWFAEGCEDVLDIREPFLDLHGFFPCPRPAYGTLERSSLKPVPDFVYYKDQVEEINELTARISALAESLKMKGFYASGNEDVAGAIETAMKQTDNNAILVPVPNFSGLGAAALKDSIVWLPVNEVAQVIVQLIELRKQLIEDVYQITGISDIMRGSTEASETLGAQQLKSQYGSVRIRDRQGEIIRIARDMTRISAEIMAENFTPETLMTYSNYDGVPTTAQVQQQLMGIQQQIQQAMSNPQIMAQAQANPEQAQQMMQQAQQEMQRLQGELTFEQVVEFIKSEKTRPFALEIETDSTILPDENAQKQRTTEFLGALATALAQLAPMVQAQPQSAEFAGEVLKFAVAPFRAGRSLEASIEGFTDQIKQVAQQPKPDPEAEKLKAEQAAKQAEMQMKQQQMQIDIQIKEKELEIKVAEGEAKIALEQQKLELERQRMQLEGVKMQQDAEFKDREIEQRGEDRKAASNTELTKAGLPPDYSFEDDRQQFSAMMDRMEKADEATAKMVAVVSENQAAIAQALAELGAAIKAPKRVVRGPDGSPIGIEGVQ